MGRQTINIGTTPRDKTGDPLRTGGDKINDNFIELYDIYNGNTYRTTISPENISIPTDYDGANPDLTNAISTIYVNTATEDQTASWLWVIDTETDCTATVSSNNIVTIDTITADSGIITLTASNIAFPTVTLTATITVTRAKQGEPGTAGSVSVDDDTIQLNGSGELECLILGRSTTSTKSGRFWYDDYETTRTTIAGIIGSGSDEPQRQGDYSIGLGRYSLNTGRGTIGMHAGNPYGQTGGFAQPNTPYTGNYCLIIGEDIFNVGGGSYESSGVMGSGNNSILIGNDILNEGDGNVIVKSSSSLTTDVTGDNNLIITAGAKYHTLRMSNSLVLAENIAETSTTVKNVFSRGDTSYIEHIGENSITLSYGSSSNGGYKLSDLLLGKKSSGSSPAILSLTGDGGSDYVRCDALRNRGQQVIPFKLMISTINNLEDANFEYFWGEYVGAIIVENTSYTVVDFTALTTSGVAGGITTTVTATIPGTDLLITVATNGSAEYNHTGRLELTQVSRQT